MPEFIIGDEIWSLLTAAKKMEAVRAGRANLKQLKQGLLDESEELRSLCREVLGRSNNNTSRSIRTAVNENVESPKSRAGLPSGFSLVDRSQRSRLLEENVYRLPDGREFVPCIPRGALGTIGHRYALLTLDQYTQSRRGSVYIRTDGRIFDYSDSSLTANDLFDTGFKMDDLERTGRYVSRPPIRISKNKKAKRS